MVKNVNHGKDFLKDDVCLELYYTYLLNNNTETHIQTFTYFGWSIDLVLKMYLDHQDVSNSEAEPDKSTNNVHVQILGDLDHILVTVLRVTVCEDFEID